MVSPSTNTRPATYYTLPQLFFHLWVIISVFLVVIFMNKFTERVGRVALEKPTQIRRRKLNFHAQSVKILSISSRTNSRGQKILYLKKKKHRKLFFFSCLFLPRTRQHDHFQPDYCRKELANGKKHQLIVRKKKNKTKELGLFLP